MSATNIYLVLSALAFLFSVLTLAVAIWIALFLRSHARIAQRILETATDISIASARIEQNQHVNGSGIAEIQRKVSSFIAADSSGGTSPASTGQPENTSSPACGEQRLPGQLNRRE